MKHLRYITDAAMTAGIAVALLFISHYLGIELEEMLPFLFAIPTAIYTMKYGFNKGWIPAIAISAISILHNPLHALFYIVPTNIIGVLYGLTLNKEKKTKVCIAIAILGSFIVNLLTIWIFSNLLYGYTIYENIRETINSLFLKLNIQNEEFGIFINAISNGLVPSLILIVSIIEGYVFHLMTIIIVNRVFNKTIKQENNLFNFLVPKEISCIYALLLILLLFLIPRYLEIIGFWKVVLNIAINLLTIGALFYIYEALLLILKFSKIKNTMWVYAVSCILVIFLFPLFVLFGLIDSFFNLQIRLIK